MTILDLAGPVLLRVLPTTVAVLLATACAVALPLALPRLITWLKGPAPVTHHTAHHGEHHTPHHSGHHTPQHPGHHGAHHAPHGHGADAVEREHTYSI